MLRRLITDGVFVVLFYFIPGGTPYETSMYENCTNGGVEFIGDGYCDEINNKKSCSYDGGDCCRCSCFDGLEYECGLNGFDCLDEGCLDPSIADQLPDCAGTLLKLGDGNCDGINNTPDCGYDGGDCCICTCVGSMTCSSSGFNCVDPNAGDELYACDEIPSEIIFPCSDHVDQNWIVEDAAQARTLAETTMCSGGSFQVEWRGNISMDQTIYAVDGTVLHIHGTHAGAVMSGNREKRLITVVNASLYLTDVRVEFGLAVVGGAIAASRSNLILNQTFFVSNQARSMGGALYVTDESIVSFNGETTFFANNVADISGGAIYVAGGSDVSWKGRNTSFIDNLSDLDGGAATIRDGSVASWSGAVSFSNNTCGGYGGAVHASDHTNLAWDGPTYFFNNTAGYYGGGISSIDGSNVSWSAEMTLDHNFAGVYGGGVLLNCSTLSWSGVTRLYDNRAGVYGGAMFVYNHSDVFGSGDTTYARNSAPDGGAIFVSDNCTMSWSGEAIFSSNTAQNGIGGAVYVQDSSQAFWSEKTTFANNSAKHYGGGIFVHDNCTVLWSGETVFSSNTAQNEDGGGVVVYDSSQAVWSGNTTFANNSAKRYGGGILVRYNCTVSWSGEAIFSFNTAQNGSGGAVYVHDSSQALWSGKTTFANNSAKHFGGGIIVIDNCTVSWSGETIFASNTVENDSGGAVYVYDSSQGFWSEKTTFANNSAKHYGGGIFVHDSCNISWSGETVFSSNTAQNEDGGGVVVYDSSQAVWSGNTTFANNSAKQYGGGILVQDDCTVSWSGETIFSSNTAQNDDGGAVYVRDSSQAFWSGRTTFANNSAKQFGGGILVVDNCTVSWSGETTFSSNTAQNDSGGAVYVYDSSQAFWSGKTTFANNSAKQYGGGILVVDNCTVLWSGETIFSSNTAQNEDGGGVVVYGSSQAFWSGTTTFANNSAKQSGGGISVRYNCTVSWSGETIFSSNTAPNNGGGGVYVTNSSQVLWSGNTTFTNNSAVNGIGGAIVLQLDSTVFWNSETTFTKNTATAGGAVAINTNCNANFNGKTAFDANAASNSQGGALSIVYSNVYFRDKAAFVGNTAITFGGAVAVLAEISASYRGSSFVLAGSTVFDNNTCETNGGALAMIGGILFQLETTEIIFSGNRATIAGGAIFMWGNHLGPYYIGVNFFSNSAPHGGGVYSTGSGNALYGLDSEQRSNPVVFIGCGFVDNQAVATGAAIHSASGQDLVINTKFSGNTASEGGALNLAGTSSLVNCSFVENISDEGRGPVVANNGYMSGISNCSFHSNAFSCQRGEFLGYHLSNNVFEVLCNGCKEPCEGCYFERPSMSPFCSKTMENSDSPGGLTMLERVMINPGYWRATPLGKEVLPCYNTDACLGGLTGEPGFCLEGYEGPSMSVGSLRTRPFENLRHCRNRAVNQADCAICSYGFSGSFGYICKRCSNSIGGIVVAIVFVLALLVAVILAVSYLLSTELDRGTQRRACVERLMRYIPMQSVKVVIVTWQIVIQFVSVANVQYPYEYQRFIDGVKLLDFDLGWMLSASCVVNIDFHDRLLFTTIGPIVVILSLGMTYYIAACRNRQSEGAVQIVQRKHLSAVILLTFFVYSNVSSMLFQTFACEHLEDEQFYLRADYRIECDSAKHETLQVYAAIMIIMYTFGIPAFYATLLFKNRDILKADEFSRNNCSRVLPTSSLWRPYKPRVFYFEAIECIRRALLVGVVVFFKPNTASQIAVTLILAFASVVISESLHPYASRWNTWLSRTGHVVVFFTVYVALLLKVNVSSERRDSQRAFEVVLVVFNVCMIVAVIIQALVMACSLECLVGRRRDDGILPDVYTRFRPMRWLVARAI